MEAKVKKKKQEIVGIVPWVGANVRNGSWSSLSIPFPSSTEGNISIHNKLR